MSKKFSVRTDILAPEEEWKREYSGRHPSKLLKAVPGIMKETLELKSSWFFEDRIKWDDLNPEGVKWYGEWRGGRTKDQWSRIWFRIIVQGVHDSKMQGKVEVRMKAWISTRFSYETMVDKTFKWLNFDLFYEKQIKKYVKEGRELLKAMDDKIRNLLEIRTKEE